MRARVHTWLALAVAVALVRGGACVLEVTTPAFSVSTRALLYNEFLGPQSTSVVFANATLGVWQGRDQPAPAALACDQYSGRVVLIEQHGEAWMYTQELGVALALQECGAIGLVRLMHHPIGTSSFVGFSVHNADYNCCKSEGKQLTIPLLVAWHDSLQSAVEWVDQGGNATVTITGVDPNAWDDDLFQQSFFLVLFRILLPVSNFAIALVALHSLVKQVAITRASKSSVRANLLPLILLALGLEIVACVVRGVYCAIGPFFSNASLTRQEHMFLLNITGVIQMPVLFVVSTFLRRAVRFTRRHTRPRARFALPIAALCVGLLVVELLGAYSRGHAGNLSFLLLVGTATTVVVIAVSSALYLAAGLRFVQRTAIMQRHATEQVRGKVVRDLRLKFISNVVFGTVGLAMQLVAACLAFTPVFFQPVGFGTSTFLYYLGLTIAAHFHTRAFAPTRAVARKGMGSQRNSVSTNPPPRVSNAGSQKKGASLTHPVVLFPTQGPAVQRAADEARPLAFPPPPPPPPPEDDDEGKGGDEGEGEGNSKGAGKAQDSASLAKSHSQTSVRDALTQRGQQLGHALSQGIRFVTSMPHMEWRAPLPHVGHIAKGDKGRMVRSDPGGEWWVWLWDSDCEGEDERRAVGEFGIGVGGTDAEPDRGSPNRGPTQPDELGGELCPSVSAKGDEANVGAESDAALVDEVHNKDNENDNNDENSNNDVEAGGAV